MEPSPVRPRKRLLLRIGLLLLILLAAGAFLGYRQVESRRNADRVQRILDDAAAGATVLRVWGAGMRTESGFCHCAMVPKPERVFYETRDPAEIREFGSLLRARPFVEPEPACKCCGTITIDFLLGDDILLTIHPHGEMRSTRGPLPVTAETHERLEQWLSKRSIRENIQQAMRPR